MNRCTFESDKKIIEEKLGKDKYDFSKFIYNGTKQKSTVICNTCGHEFQTCTGYMKQGHGCPKCKFTKLSNLYKKTYDDFVKDAACVHGNKFDYSQFKYVTNHTKGKIICKDCGYEFYMMPSNHINQKQGCPKCSNRVLKTKDEFVEEAKKIHHDKYTYDNFVYINSETKGYVTCPIHGDFLVTPNKHKQGRGCPRCAGKGTGENGILTKEDFIENARKIHGDKYDYTNVNYVNNVTPVTIICPEHGEFKQIPSLHSHGSECPKCSTIKRGISSRMTKEDFIEKARLIHGDKYEYVGEYIKSNEPMAILCPTHGVFYRTPNSHLYKGAGCPKCSQSRLERTIELFLKNHNINYITQYRNKEILDRQTLDFFLPDYKIGIECQGIQHFIEIKHMDTLENNIKRDVSKYEKCSNNGIILLYYNDNWHLFETFDFYKDKIVITETKDILKYISTNEASN